MFKIHNTNMKKKFSRAAMAMLAVFTMTLTGCGGDMPSPKDPSNPETPESPEGGTSKPDDNPSGIVLHATYRAAEGEKVRLNTSFDFIKMTLDGKELTKKYKYYTFPSAGEYTVSYYLYKKFIEDGAFSGCTALTSIKIPEGVESIGNSAFATCTSLTSVSLPEGVASIDKYAFAYCDALSSVRLPSTLTAIAPSAFSLCSSLTDITCKAMTAPALGQEAFSYLKEGGVLTVPVGATGYETWMSTEKYYLGYYGWTIQYSDEL